jgi:uncharacterized membrane protein YqiK
MDDDDDDDDFDDEDDDGHVVLVVVVLVVVVVAVIGVVCHWVCRFVEIESDVVVVVVETGDYFGV